MLSDIELVCKLSIFVRGYCTLRALCKTKTFSNQHVRNSESINAPSGTGAQNITLCYIVVRACFHEKLLFPQLLTLWTARTVNVLLICLYTTETFAVSHACSRRSPKVQLNRLERVPFN